MILSITFEIWLLKDAVIHDVAIKCYNANLDWMMIYYLGPIYYQADESWSVMLGARSVKR